MKAVDYDTRQFYRRMGVIVRDARVAHGMSQADLATHMGLTANAIQFWEAGLRRPSADAIPDLCLVLKLTPQRLLGMDR